MKPKEKTKSNGEASGEASGNGIPVPPERRCTYRTQGGTPCRAARRKDSDYCIYHDKNFQKRRNEARACRTILDRRKQPDSAEGIHALLIRNVEELRSGKIEPRVANSIAYQAQLMKANLPELQRERSQLLPGHLEERLQNIVVDNMLEECEGEIRDAGDNAHPVKVAQRVADEASDSARANGEVPVPNSVFFPAGKPKTDN